MNKQHADTRSVVFGTEPIITWVEGGDGAQHVERYISDTYFTNIETAISHINFTEVFYVCADYEAVEFARTTTTQIKQMGVTVVDAASVWETAGQLKHEYAPDFPLGDAYALATAHERGVPLLTGEDSHWNEPLADGYEIETIP